MADSHPQKTVLVIADTPLHRDPRVLVQIRALRGKYRLIAAGRTDPGGVDEFVSIDPQTIFGKIERKLRAKLRGLLMKAGKHHLHYFTHFNVRRCLRRFKVDRKIDVILCNDIDMLPTASILKQRFGAKLYLDCHEFTPRQWDGDPAFKRMEPYWDYIMEKYVPYVDHATVVCESIGKLYEEDYGLRMANVVMNMPEGRASLEPQLPDSDKIRMVHHGILNPNRKLEEMIRLMDQLDERFTLDFYLVSNSPAYHEKLLDLAKGNARIRFNEPVPTAEIATELNQYDMGLFLLSPLSTNYRFALPNKFFEFVQARLAIAIWPSIEMKRLLDRFDLGVCSEEFSVEEIATLLNALTIEELMRYKQNSHSAAAELSASASCELIAEGVRGLLETATCPS